MVAEHSSRAERRKGHVGPNFAGKRPNSSGRSSGWCSSASPPSSPALSLASETSSALRRDARETTPDESAVRGIAHVHQAPITKLEHIQGRIGIARSMCMTAQIALEGSGVARGIDIGRALGFGFSDVLAYEFSRLYALVLCLKENRVPDEWIGRWLP